MFRTYFDSSGRPEDHPGVVVAGCVSSVEQWEQLEPEWNRALEEERVKESGGYRALHMKDLVSSRRGFEGWEETQKAVLLKRLAGLLKGHVRFLVGFGMPNSVYEATQFILFRRRSELAPHPLTFCAASCVEAVAGWCIDNSIHGEQMTYIFEDGDPNTSGIHSLMSNIASNEAKRRDFRYAGFGFGNKKLVGLQVADWVAYEALLWGRREVLPLYGETHKPRHPRRRSLEALVTIESQIVYYADHDEVLRSVRQRFDRLMGEAG